MEVVTQLEMALRQHRRADEIAANAPRNHQNDIMGRSYRRLIS
jgi:hypothetical protein